MAFMPDRSKVMAQTKRKTLVLQVGGWAVGSQPHPIKDMFCYKVCNIRSQLLKKNFGSPLTSLNYYWSLPILSQMNRVQKVLFYVWKIHFNLILSLYAQVFQRLILFRFFCKRSVWIYLPSHACYMYRPCYLPSFCHSNSDRS